MKPGTFRVDPLHLTGVDLLADLDAEIHVECLVEGEAGGFLRELCEEAIAGCDGGPHDLFALRHAHHCDRLADAAGSRRVPTRDVPVPFCPIAAAGRLPHDRDP